MDKVAEPLDQFERRKADHIRLALDPQNQSRRNANFDNIEFIHEAMPGICFAELDINTQSLGKRVKPFFVSSMTAGHKGAMAINQALAAAAAETGWRMGVGSQRRELFDRDARAEWKDLRKGAPKVKLLANLGLTQLIHSDIGSVRGVIDVLEAEALIIHLNPLQECLQVEGTPDFKGAEETLQKMCDSLEVPIIVKETGCGLSLNTMQRLRDCGVTAIDVAGRGGTHWGRIEGGRSAAETLQNQAAQTFADWGISTVESLLAAMKLDRDVEIWASGGIRSGLDGAKCFALGASQVGLAHGLLESAIQGEEAVLNKMNLIEYELKVALFCTGKKTIQGLREGNTCRILRGE
jgi:isopentenyl-diphosphate delta-isomerase